LILGLRGCGWWRGGRGEKEEEEEREGFFLLGRWCSSVCAGFA